MSNVWGNTVSVPPGGKPPFDPNVRWTRDNSQGAKPDDTQDNDQNTNPDDNPDDNQDGNQGGDKVENPTVLMPDGSRVPADTYFAKEKTELAVKEAYIQGMLEGQKQNSGTGDTSGSPEDTEKGSEPATPAFQKIEVDEEKHYEPNEQMLIEKSNENVDIFNSVMTHKDEEISALRTQLGEVTDAVSKQIFDSNLALVEATTGVTRDEIIAKNQETKITDPEILAKIILGEKAANGEDLPTALKQAEEEREENNKGVSGTSVRSGSGQGGGSGTEEPFRGLNPDEINLGGKIDAATLAKIGSAYSFAPQVVNNG
ncbi:hypothetical protein J5I95_22640 [Candidatus Poribacteria bacterium]|nr:hypothetical protein [Candidatus Poribacteria bacterium]